MGVGMPQALYLSDFGHLLFEAFGHVAYQVGSSLDGKKPFRDVDVRLMLPDEVYAAVGLGDPVNPHSNARWCALCKAFTALGERMTGLPIDFQVQQQSWANAQHHGLRSALLRSWVPEK